MTNRLNINAFLSCATTISFTLLFSQVFLCNSSFVCFGMTSTRRTYTHLQIQERIARNNHNRGNFTSRNSDTFDHAHSRRQPNNSQSVLSKYYSNPSWTSDENESSDSESSFSMSSVHLPNAHQDDSNLLSQLTEQSTRHFDTQHRRRIHLRQQSVENELVVQNQGDGRHHGTGQ